MMQQQAAADMQALENEEREAAAEAFDEQRLFATDLDAVAAELEALYRAEAADNYPPYEELVAGD